LQTIDFQAFLIHELTHVYQSQVRGGGAIPLLQLGDYDYRDKLAAGQSWDRFSLEEQATFVEDYFLVLNGVVRHHINMDRRSLSLS